MALVVLSSGVVIDTSKIIISYWVDKIEYEYYYLIGEKITGVEYLIKFENNTEFRLSEEDGIEFIEIMKGR